jgi:serine/threonine-protein kinase
MFEVLGKLGAGGMADVFLARGEFSGSIQTVALKRMRVTAETQPEAVSRFTREAAIGRLLRHPNIVRVLDAGVDKDGPYLAMEYVAGATAVQLVNGEVRRGKTMPQNLARIIVRDIADGIAYAHAFQHDGGAGLLHRDISPDNVLVGADGRAKVSDFGIARFEGQTQITTTGEVRGKLSYLAPELFQGRPHTVASDVFALGATVFRIFAGVPAFRGNNDADLIRNVMFVKPPNLRDVRPGVPEPLADWVERAMSSDPVARPTPTELAACLPDVTDGERIVLGTWVRERMPASAVTIVDAGSGRIEIAAAPSMATPAPGQAQPRSRLPLFASVCAVLALAAGGAAVVVLRPAPSTAPAPIAQVPDPAPAPAPAPEPVAEPSEPAPTPEPEHEPDKAKTPVRTARKFRRGSLEVHVSPFADVFVDGDLVGTTPMKPIELAPGTHKVILANTALNARRTFRVVIEPDKKSRLDADLRQTGP